MNYTDFREISNSELAVEFMRIRKTTIKIFDLFHLKLGESLYLDMDSRVNLPRWEFTHVAWFSERWILRNPDISLGKNANLSKNIQPDIGIQPFFCNADKLFDSSLLVHKDRWREDLPSFSLVKKYLKETESKIVDKINTEKPITQDECYFYKLSLAHEYMHNEAFIMTANTLGFPVLNIHKVLARISDANKKSLNLFVKKTGRLDLNDSSGFIFDNETISHATPQDDFEIDSVPVSIEQMLEFSEFGGYNTRRFWSTSGWNWLQKNKNCWISKLIKCKLSSEKINFFWFGKNIEISTKLPAFHISFYEAEAYCNWKKRRLPTESEWLLSSNHSEFSWGDVWEWTSTVFERYKKFRAHPYVDYSEPWFGDHQVVKGSSFATQAVFKNKKFRNFYRKNRNDPFIGFRTVKKITSQ